MTGRGTERLGLGAENGIEDVKVVSVYVQLRLKWGGGCVGNVPQVLQKAISSLGVFRNSQGHLESMGWEVEDESRQKGIKRGV